MEPSPSLLGTAEAATRIGIERSTLTRWVAAGRIKVAAKLPGRTGAVLFTRDEVERVAKEYLAERTPVQVRPEEVAAS